MSFFVPLHAYLKVYLIKEPSSSVDDGQYNEGFDLDLDRSTYDIKSLRPPRYTRSAFKICLRMSRIVQGAPR